MMKCAGKKKIRIIAWKPWPPRHGSHQEDEQIRATDFHIYQKIRSPDVDV